MRINGSCSDTSNSVLYLALARTSHRLAFGRASRALGRVRLVERLGLFALLFELRAQTPTLASLVLLRESARSLGGAARLCHRHAFTIVSTFGLHT
jgi:hypothetical protein